MDKSIANAFAFIHLRFIFSPRQVTHGARLRFANGDARIPIAIALRRSSAPGLGSRDASCVSRPDSSLGHPCAIRMDVLARVLGVGSDRPGRPEQPPSDARLCWCAGWSWDTETTDIVGASVLSPNANFIVAAAASILRSCLERSAMAASSLSTSARRDAR